MNDAALPRVLVFQRPSGRALFGWWGRLQYLNVVLLDLLVKESRWHAGT